MPPEDEDLDPIRTMLLGLGQTLTPIYEFAEGQKAELERRGWSPTAAEAAALVILCDSLHLAFSSGG